MEQSNLIKEAIKGLKDLGFVSEYSMDDENITLEFDSDHLLAILLGLPVFRLPKNEIAEQLLFGALNSEEKMLVLYGLERTDRQGHVEIASDEAMVLICVAHLYNFKKVDEYEGAWIIHPMIPDNLQSNFHSILDKILPTIVPGLPQMPTQLLLDIGHIYTGDEVTKDIVDRLWNGSQQGFIRFTHHDLINNLFADL